MSNEIKVQNENSALMSVIERVATDPNADISKLEKMLEMQERVLNRDAAQAFTSDIAMMQSEMPRVVESAKAHNSNYAKLEDINDTIKPILSRFGFAVTFNIEQPTVKEVSITAILSHRLGHTQRSSILLPVDTSGSKNAVQAVGSTVSYGKRYTICALLNISTGDDTNGFDLGNPALPYKLTEDDKKSITNAPNIDKLRDEFISLQGRIKGDELQLSELTKLKDEAKAKFMSKEKAA